MVLTRLEQMMMDDGIRIGESRGHKMGIEEAQNRMTVLYVKFHFANRTSEFMQVCRNEKYGEKLMKELGIK